MQPNYKNIYADIIHNNFPSKIAECSVLLDKPVLSTIDVLKLNEKIFGTPNTSYNQANQRHKSYSKKDILYILDYQKKQQLNNIQLSIHFKMSRNTIAKWKKLFT